MTIHNMTCVTFYIANIQLWFLYWENRLHSKIISCTITYNLTAWEYVAVIIVRLFYIFYLLDIYNVHNRVPCWLAAFKLAHSLAHSIVLSVLGFTNTAETVILYFPFRLLIYLADGTIFQNVCILSGVPW